MNNLITQCFSVDHEKIDFLFRMYRKYKQHNRYQAALLFEKFSEQLQQHIAWEEDLLFPAYEISAQSKHHDNILLLYQEHQQIINKVESIRQHLIAHTDCEALEQELSELMLLHNEKEEHVLYEQCDRAIDEARCMEIFLDM